ncbi:class I SAM-dependent methyltransferase [Flammeovirga agarivorans]|uniref:SAM-dependent methyltransferase n=1 Tax=Flammeovirga agarivorans TaxID=2726742 RepID=A0A7X8XVR7_9BACT|nr:class I SAM-dependent methyltransferase [Flammeovirga agarivorans]NLR91340.1 SAM-dependent methyltransferase [Flammeovirga agarivorans]
MINKATKEFILNNEKANPTDVVLMSQKLIDVDSKVAAHQIVSRQKAKKKLPAWYNNIDIEYPAKVPLEQSSSERAARHKASLIKGKTLIDLTGGMGVDDWAFSYSFDQVIYAERQEDLSEVTQRNFNVLGRENITVISGDSLQWLAESDVELDAIYIDPARRDKENRKLVRIDECEPNVLEHIDLFQQKSATLLIKLSPMIDIKHTLRQLEKVTDVWVVAVDGECKEVLFLVDFQNQLDKTNIHCVDLKGKEETVTFSFIHEDEEYLEVELASELQQYLYEPNASVMKGGGFKVIASQFGLKKLHLNTHLYTSDTLLENFPGRRFLINKTVPVQKKAVKKEIPNAKANLSVRNFPQTVDQLKAKLKLKDGGDTYIFATTILNNEKILVVCERVTTSQ